MNNSEQPAFANPGSDQGNGSSGLTKREYFAAMAMQGMISIFMNKEVAVNDVDSVPVICAQWSLKYADELLKQLES